MHNIFLLDLEDGALEMPETIELPSDLSKANIKIKLKLSVHYTATEDIVMEDLIVSYIRNDARILTYGLRAVFNIDGWAQTLKEAADSESLRQNSELIESVKITLGALRGALFAKTQQTPLNKLFLPLADISRVMAHADLNLITK